ncbi:MAG: hypothetical protein QW727_03635 [Candidatus Pacearchaeota archaeon]
MKKSLGYFFIIMGIIVLVTGIKPINESISKNIPQISNIDGNILLIIGGGLCIVGVLFTRFFSNSSKQPAEVPIYHGKNIVGFRRIKNR